MKVARHQLIALKVKVLVAELCLILCNPMYCARLLCPWILVAGKPKLGSHSFLQGIFPMQELNLVHLHCRQILYQLSHQESPKVDLKEGRLIIYPGFTEYIF